jgi:hypothetical protein
VILSTTSFGMSGIRLLRILTECGSERCGKTPQIPRLAERAGLSLPAVMRPCSG